MITPLDTRPWNLLAGLAALVTAGCGGRTASGDAGSNTTSDADATTGNPDSSSTDPDSSEDPPECIESTDCPTGYYCIDGVCEYQVAPDGGPWFECYSNSDCGPSVLCVDHYCEPVPSLESCGDPVYEPPLPFDLNIPDALLAIAFADADDDGREQLVVVTQFEIHASSPEATLSSPRELESPTLEGMVAGDLDGNPGDDILLVHDDTLWLHAADGLGSFALPTESVSPIVGTAGLRVGNLDDQGLDDLLVFGQGGASLMQLGGGSMPLTMNPVSTATTREFGQSGGVGLRNSDLLEFYTLDAALFASSPVAEPTAVGPVASVHWADAWYDLSATHVATNQGTAWTVFEQWAPAAVGMRVAVWGIGGETVAIERGDFDGDGHDELALIHANLVWVMRDGGGPNQCLEQLDFNQDGLGEPERIAVGDYDGDGDDDLAAVFSLGAVFIRDAAGS